MYEGEGIWNQIELAAPEPHTLPVTLTPILLRRYRNLWRALSEPIKVLSEMDILHTEATALSRFLYKNYRVMKKDKGIQLLKITLTSLKKYARLDVLGNLIFFRELLAFRTTNPVVPTRSVLGWLLCRIQVLAVLFYRIHHLTKRAGKFLYGRIRLLWNPMVLLLCLGMAARIFVLARFIVLQCTTWYSSLISSMAALPKANPNLFKDIPENLEEWLGGLADLKPPLDNKKSYLDVMFDLVDLTQHEDDEENDFVQIINEYGAVKDKDEIERLCEIVTLDDKQDTIKLDETLMDEDIGQPVDKDGIPIVNSSDNESVIECYPSKLSEKEKGPQKKNLKRKRGNSSKIQRNKRRKNQFEVSHFNKFTKKKKGKKFKKEQNY